MTAILRHFPFVERMIPYAPKHMRISLTPTIRTSSIPSAPAPIKTGSTASQLMATASIAPVPCGVDGKKLRANASIRASS